MGKGKGKAVGCKAGNLEGEKRLLRRAATYCPREGMGNLPGRPLASWLLDAAAFRPNRPERKGAGRGGS